MSPSTSHTEESDVFHPRDSLTNSIEALGYGATAGFLMSAIQTALTKRNIGTMAVFTRSGGLITSMALSAFAYEFTRDASANLREFDDAFNPAIGGFIGGSVLGLMSKRIPVVIGLGFTSAATLGGLDYTSRMSLRSRQEITSDEDYAEKLAHRYNRRRPIEETLANVGENRFIKAPGYEERRRERLKEKYGVEINPVKIYEE